MSKSGDRLDREFRHVLRRCSILTDAECRFLAVLGSYGHGCKLNYDQLCEITSWGRTKLKSVITSLKKYGLIEVKYSNYKRTCISIANASKQTDFAEAHDGRSSDHRQRSPDRPLMVATTPPHGRPNDHSILERDLERNLESDEIKKDETNENVSINVNELIQTAFPNWKRNAL